MENFEIPSEVKTETMSNEEIGYNINLTQKNSKLNNNIKKIGDYLNVD